MKRNVLVGASALVITCLAASVVGAVVYKRQTYGELSGAFCPAMADEASYKSKSINQFALLIPGKDGVIFRTANDFRTDWTLKPETVAYLKQLQTALRARNADLVLVIPPVRGLVQADFMTRTQKKTYGFADVGRKWAEYEGMIQQLNDAGIRTVGIGRNEAPENMFYKRNHHWTAEGARLAAQKVAAVVKTLSEYADIPKIQFQTAVVEEGDTYKSSYAAAFRKICNTKVPPEKVNNYETAPVGAVASENALFSDSAVPRVILLGTSNSVNEASRSNFEGFLKEALSADVENRAVVGAGIDTSIVSYLNSGDLDSAQKRVLIWEIPGYYNLNLLDDKLFNQIVPAAYGACSQPIARQDFSSLPAGQTRVLFSLARASAPAENVDNVMGPPAPPADWSAQLKDGGYLHIRFERPSKNPFAVKFAYKDTGVKKQDFLRDSDYRADRDFYTLLPASKDVRDLVSIQMTAKKASLPAASITVCPLPQT